MKENKNNDRLFLTACGVESAKEGGRRVQGRSAYGDEGFEMMVVDFFSLGLVIRSVACVFVGS